MIILFPLCGAIWNRIRGDGIPFGKTANDLAFGLLVGLYLQSVTYGALATLGMAIGRAPGWGVYIGCLGRWETTDLKEWAPIDWMLRNLKPKPVSVEGKIHKYMPEHLRFYGYLALMGRGMFWGAMIGIAIGSPLPAVGGLLMPMCYQAGMAIYPKYVDEEYSRVKAWETGEILFGAVLWYYTALGLGV